MKHEEMEKQIQAFITGYTVACAMVEELTPGANIAHAYPYPQLANVLAVLKHTYTERITHG